MSAIENAQGTNKKGKKLTGFASIIRPSGKNIEDVFREAIHDGYLPHANSEYSGSGASGRTYAGTDFRIDDFIEAVADDMRRPRHFSAEHPMFEDTKSIEEAEAEFYAAKTQKEKTDAGLSDLSDEEFYGQKTLADFVSDEDVK